MVTYLYIVGCPHHPANGKAFAAAVIEEEDRTELLPLWIFPVPAITGVVANGSNVVPQLSRLEVSGEGPYNIEYNYVISSVIFRHNSILPSHFKYFL